MHRPLYVFIGVDPSMGHPEGDETGIIVLGVDWQKNRYVLAAISGLFKPSVIVQKLFELNDYWNPQLIGIEEVGMQQILADWIYEKQLEMNKFLPLARNRKELRPIGKKEDRIYGRLQPLQESGKLYIRRTQTNLITQLMNFPKGKRRDLLDALVYADSIAYFPNKQLEKNIEKKRERRFFDWLTR